MKLFKHQEISLAYYGVNDFFALFMEQGCGKTLPTIIHILELLKGGLISDALIIAPKSVLGSWYRDFEIFNPSDRDILNGSITLVSYDTAWRRPNLVKHWGCIVLDESHFIKNRSTNRSQFVLKLALHADYRYILTGTPIGNGKLEDIWAQYAFLDPVMVRGRVASRIFGTYKEFLDKYCILNEYYQPCSYTHVNELQDIISDYSYRVKKKDCLDLPEKLDDVIYEIELKENKLYKELHKHSTLEEYEILADNPLSRLVKLRQLCSGHIKTADGLLDVKCEKINVLNEFLDGYDKKLVIFAQFARSIDQIEKLLKKLKIKYVTLDGRQRNKFIWRDFQSNPKIQVIVCQYESASAGIDLFSADTILYYEPTLRSNTLEQSRDRIHRTGQKNACSYIHFITKGTVEEEIYKTLKGYSDFSEKVFTKYMDTYQRKYDTTKRKKKQ